jgi:oligoribonuclease
MLGIFLDSETNGLNPYVHSLLEIAFKIINLSSGQELGCYESVIFQPKSVWETSDPESLKVNGFTHEMILKGKEEKVVEKEIVDLFTKLHLNRKNSVFICQNPSFDRVFFSKIIYPQKQEELAWPYHWLDLASMYWALYIERAKKISDFSGFSKDKIANSLNLPPEERPHKALNGVNHLLLCYRHLVGFPEKQP